MKKISFHLFLSMLATTWCGFSASAQSIDSTLLKYARQYQQEKAWLHYDKAVYYPGETIWFKAYLMEGLYPAMGSKTFYVDWVGDDGEVLYHTVSPVVDAASVGQFEIPESYTGQSIHVKAYTKWMLNFDTAFVYQKDIRILNKNAAPKTGARPATVTTLAFFPEGGEAIAGVKNKIAFKATDQWGTPMRVRGVIQDNKGTVVDSFRSVHHGMGFVMLQPRPGFTYSAKWKDEKGKEHLTSLPPAKPEGIAMQVSLDGSRRVIEIQGGGEVPDHLKQVHLVGTLGQIMAFKTTVPLQPGQVAKRIIPTENLASGILTITLFDAAWNAIAERITFINNREYSFPTAMEVQHWGLNKRARNELLITIPDSLQGAQLSLSVTDAAIGHDTASHIISHLLLTSDIKGAVHQPAYYFANWSDKVAQQLDLVMLTNGWRRFKWEDVVKGRLPEINYPRDSTYLALAGKLYGVAKSQLSGNESIFLFVKEKDSSMRSVLLPITREGTFGDPEFIFFDTLRVYYQLKSKFFGNAEARFMTDRLPAFNYKRAGKNLTPLNLFNDTAGNARQAFLAAEALRLQNIERGKVLENITITAKTKPPLQVLDEKYARGLFSGGDTYQFDLVNDPSAIGRLNIFNYLQGRVAGLQISSTGNTPTLSWRGGTPQLFLDEMPIDASVINSIPIGDIAYVKVFRPPFLGVAGGGASGAIAIYTRKGDDLKSRPGSLSTNTIAGYTPFKEFYSPNYASFDKRHEQMDVRTTLYWNPSLNLTPGRSSVKVSFYNNDVSKAFRVVITGLSREGLMTHHEEIME